MALFGVGLLLLTDAMGESCHAMDVYVLPVCVLVLAGKCARILCCGAGACIVGVLDSLSASLPLADISPTLFSLQRCLRDLISSSVCLALCLFTY
jgi:hypothetical protein